MNLPIVSLRWLPAFREIFPGTNDFLPVIFPGVVEQYVWVAGVRMSARRRKDFPVNIWGERFMLLMGTCRKMLKVIELGLRRFVASCLCVLPFLGTPATDRVPHMNTPIS